MAKRPKGKKRSPSPLKDAVDRYSKAQSSLRAFEAKHEGVIVSFRDLVNDVDQAKKSLTTLTLENSEFTEKGKHTAYEDDRITVRHKIGARRSVDAAKLLKKYPKLRGWEGLLTVTLGKFDAVVEAGQVSAEDAEALVTEKPTNSVEIVPKDTNG